MTNKNYTTRVSKVKVSDLKVSPYLQKYGVSTVPDFVTKQMKKFNLKPDQIIATKDNIVLYNAEGLEQAKQLNLKEVDVVIIDGLEEDELIQVTAFKNMGKKVKRRVIAEVIRELEEYMTNDEKGKVWKDEVPGSRINDKISFLIGKSYGSVYSIREMYKYNTDLLDKIDNGSITIKEAEEEIAMLKKNEEDELNGDGNGEENENHSESEEDNADETSGETDVKGKKKPRRLAGERNMVECEPLVGIELTYKSGRKSFIAADGSQACLESDGIVVRDYKYESHLFHPEDNSEIHTFITDKDKNSIQVSIVNRDINSNLNNKAA